MATKQAAFFFSDDLIGEILIRVSLKSLQRCKCVCKGWRLLISNPSFYKAFLTRSKSKSAPPLLNGIIFPQEHHDKPRHLSHHTLYNFSSNKNEIQVDLRLSFLQRFKVIIASHNGLILCLQKLDELKFFCQTRYYIVCNPVTKQWVELPRSTRRHNIKHTVLVCYPSEDEDRGVEFDVVALVDKRKVEKFSSVDWKWSVSQISHQYNDDSDDESVCEHVFSNGFVYSWNLRPMPRHPPNYALDLNTNSKCLLQFPPTSHADLRFRLVGVSCGLVYYAESSYTCFRIWVLVGGAGWSLVHHIDYESWSKEFLQVGISDCCICPIAFHPSMPDLLLVSLWHKSRLRDRNYYVWRDSPLFGGNNLFLYNSSTRKIQVIHNFYPGNVVALSPISYSLSPWLLCLSLCNKKRSKHKRQAKRPKRN